MENCPEYGSRFVNCHRGVFIRMATEKGMREACNLERFMTINTVYLSYTNSYRQSNYKFKVD